jgi:methyl-accepting chemotaxis protein
MYSEEMKLAMSLANNPRLAAAAAPAAKLAGRAANESAVSDVHALLQGIMQLDSTYESVSLVDCQGNVISSGVSGLSGSNISSMGYFKEAIAGRANMGSVVISKDTGKPVTPIAVPVRLGENVVGAVVLALKIDFLGNMVAGNRVGRTGYVAVVDSAGMTLVG